MKGDLGGDMMSMKKGLMKTKLIVGFFGIILLLAGAGTAQANAQASAQFQSTDSRYSSSTNRPTRKPKPAPPSNNGGNVDAGGPIQGSGQVVFDTCFSPAGGCDKKLIQFIDNAKSSLDIAIYSITHSGIAQAIISAKNRGLAVRMVVDRSQSKGKSSLVSNLQSAGIPLKIGNFAGIMHNKFTIVDGEFMETGSYNYTGNATNNNGENQLYLNDSGVIQRYMANFEEIYQNGLAN